MSQRKQILHWLMTKKTLTPMEALKHFGCFRLGARIYELRQGGCTINREMIEVKPGTHVARYKLLKLS